MNKPRNNDEQLPRDLEPDEAQDQPEDTEGHMFLPNDPSTARALAQGRSAEMEREARERRRQKEARPNRR